MGRIFVIWLPLVHLMLCGAVDVNLTVALPPTSGLTLEGFEAGLPSAWMVLGAGTGESLISIPLICPEGYYCSAMGVIPVPCPAGTYNPVTDARNISMCLPCEQGAYCPSGSAAPTNCAAGTFRDAVWGR